MLTLFQFSPRFVIYLLIPNFGKNYTSQLRRKLEQIFTTYFFLKLHFLKRAVWKETGGFCD